MGYVLAAAAVIGTLAALRTVILAKKTVGLAKETSTKLDRQLELMGRQLGTMDDQLMTAGEHLEAVAKERTAQERLARIQAIERTADALCRVAEVAQEVVSRIGNTAQLEQAPLLPIERARLQAAVSAARALGCSHLASSYAVAAGSESTTLAQLASAATTAMQMEITSALDAEVQGARD